MFMLVKILHDNHISVRQFQNDLGFFLMKKITKVRDFKISELIFIKDVLVRKNIIDSDFDIGLFLNEI